LKIHLSSILEELVSEKKEKINNIDMTIKNQKGIGNMLAALQTEVAESANELIRINNLTQPKSLVIKSHTYNQEQKIELKEFFFKEKKNNVTHTC
ncbi:19011_t:CDS:2, partial [Racocetra fulgida]